MLKKRTLSEVAETVGVSNSAVSRAVNHCHGLSTEIRDTILAEADRAGLGGKVHQTCDVYLILPENPNYFWSALYEAVIAELSNQNIRIKANIYSKLNDKTIVERYLCEAERLQAKVILIAARYPELDTQLSQIAADRAVFSVCEPCSAANVFYFGSDRTEDGRLLAHRCIENHPNAINYLFLGTDPLRRQGFLEVAENVHILKCPPRLGYAQTSAELARDLEQLLSKSQCDVIVCFDGFAAKICQALKKLRRCIPVYGFEMQPLEERYGSPAGLVCQDLSALGIQIANSCETFLKKSTYPASKNTLITSFYYQQL